ncbi:hypothetical protein JCM10212_004711 [Sporobolomyces blumeae]
MSSDKSLSQHVGDATNGTVGEQTLLNEVQQLASHTIQYGQSRRGASPRLSSHSRSGKGLVSKDASSDQSIGKLVSEARDLTGHVLHAASDVIATGADKAKDAANDAQASAQKEKPVGYVAQARDLAASALSTAESYIATGQKKVEETSTDDVKQQAQGALDTLNQKVHETKDDASNKAAYYAETGKDKTNDTLATAGSELDNQLKK